jgi:hypothetical protein
MQVQPLLLRIVGNFSDRAGERRILRGVAASDLDLLIWHR